MAYGLKIDSELLLPELELGGSPKSDVVISYGEVGDKYGEYLFGTELFFWLSPNTFLLRIPRVAKYLVKNGNQIIVEPEPYIDDDSVRLFLLGAVFGVLLFQRHYLVLHGNAIQIKDKCILCVGDSGAGKSTLAAGFLYRGYRVLADDVVPVNKNFNAIPGFPRIKLWRDAAEQFNIDTTKLRRVQPQIDKYNYPISYLSNIKELPIHTIYVLDNYLNADLAIDQINGFHRFKLLHKHTYRINFLNTNLVKKLHFELCSKLAERVRMARIVRPKFGCATNSIIDKILADVDNSL
jgi:hypothetical protein